MPKFKFVVRDGRGRERRGSIEHETIEEARRQLEGRGFVVKRLLPPPSLGRRRGGAPTPALSKRLRDWLGATFSSARLAYLALFLLGLAILVTVGGGKQGEGRQLTEPVVQPTDLKLKADLVGYQEGMRAILKLPEIPLTIALDGVSESGQVRWERKLLTSQRLTKARFEVILTGESNDVVARRQLEIPGSGNLDLGSISIEGAGEGEQ